MTNPTFATQTAEAAQSMCPTGCAGHLDGPVHISNAQQVTLTGDGERSDAFISLERRDTPDAAEALVRLVGAGDTPMQPQQSIELGYKLIAAGVAAVSSWQVTR